MAEVRPATPVAMAHSTNSINKNNVSSDADIDHGIENPFADYPPEKSYLLINNDKAEGSKEVQPHTSSDQTLSPALADKEAPCPSPASIDTSQIRDQAHNLTADFSDFLTSEPLRVMFADYPTVFYVHKEIIRRLLCLDADTDSQLDQAEIQLTAVHPDTFRTMIRALYSPNPRRADLGLPSLSSSGVLDLYAAATKLGHHQWIRMACLEELESRPSVLTDLVGDFQALYHDGHADREARDTFKRVVARELDRDWPGNFLSQFLASVSRKGGDLAADLVEAIVGNRSTVNNSPGEGSYPLGPPAPEATKLLGKHGDGVLHPAWHWMAGKSEGTTPTVGQAHSDNRCWLGPTTNWHQSPHAWGQNGTSRASLVQTCPASDAAIAAWSVNTDPHEATQEISQGNDGKAAQRPAAVNMAPWPQAMPQLPITHGASLPTLIPPSRSAEPGLIRPRVRFSSGEDSQGRIETVPAFDNGRKCIQISSPVDPVAALFQHPGNAPVGMPHDVPDYGYNRMVTVGNGMIHPTSMGEYGLAGRKMVATRDSGIDCTLFFRAGDLIYNVIPVYPGASHSNALSAPLFPGVVTYFQGICRGRAGQFPSVYVREVNRSAFRGLADSITTPTKAPAAARTTYQSALGPRGTEEMRRSLARMAQDNAGAEEQTCGNWGCGKDQCRDCRGDEIVIGRRQG